MFTKNFKKVSAVLLLSSLGVAGLISCGTENKEYTVDFKIQDASNAWAIYKTETAVNGKVEAPEAPVKQYYTFGGWYETEAFEKAFETTGIKKDSEAYGKYIPEEVTVHINDDDPIAKNLIDVVNATYNPGEGLDFDGWYEDAAYTLKWDGHKTVTDLYAKSVALITFNNGYEDVYTTTVKPGNVFTDPSKTEFTLEDGTVTTLEKAKVLKEYMDEYDVHYVDAEGNPFDFTKPITKSTTITVNWNTVGLRNSIKYWEKTDSYRIETYSLDSKAANAPVWSMQSTFTQIVKEGPENTPVEHVRKIDGFSAYGATWLPTKAKKLIFGEGIQFVAGMNAGAANVIEEISLPSTLKVIDNSFSFMPNLKGVTLPEGLEVIVGSFFKETDASTDYYRSIVYGTNYGFDIEIPASVKNLAMVPTNLTFAEGSNFYKEDGRIFLNSEKGKVLVSDAEHINDGTIYVPDGVVGIQTGTYVVPFDYLFLPETFKFVNYNEDISNYPFYDFELDSGSSYTASANHLYDAKNAATPTPSMSPISYAITCGAGGYNRYQCLDGAGYVVFAANEVPAELAQFAICGDRTGYAASNGAYVDFRDETLKDCIVLNDNAENVYVTISYYLVLDYDEDWNPIFTVTTPDAEGAMKVNVNAVIPTKVLTETEIIDAIKLANPDRAAQLEESLTDRTVTLTSNNKEITADQIKGEMYVVMTINY